jgi:hypothetical protein
MNDAMSEPMELYELVLMRPGEADEVVPFEHSEGLGVGDRFERGGVEWVVLEQLDLPQQYKEAVFRYACRMA